MNIITSYCAIYFILFTIFLYFMFIQRPLNKKNKYCVPSCFIELKIWYHRKFAYLTKSKTLFQFQYVSYIFNQDLSCVPEHNEGKSNEKTEGSSKLGNEWGEGIDEDFFLPDKRGFRKFQWKYRNIILCSNWSVWEGEFGISTRREAACKFDDVVHVETP